MDEIRANPDEILHRIKKESNIESRGHLKIFFGYAAGVGKTYAMLKAAHAAKRRGLDIVVGYVEPHTRPQTLALLDGLEQLPTLTVSHKGISLHEFDLDGAIKRAPQLILVDELAHTNAEGCRHSKRYQDVEELLRAGIDVYTTVNVQHIESLNDMVASITGVTVRERVPDHLFDDADQVELVDIEPEELIDRLHAGQIYQEAQANRALEHFFSIENLTALREIALRRCADRINKMSEKVKSARGSGYFTAAPEVPLEDQLDLPILLPYQCKNHSHGGPHGGRVQGQLNRAVRRNAGVCLHERGKQAAAAQQYPPCAADGGGH